MLSRHILADAAERRSLGARLAQAKAKRAKSDEKTRWQACLPLSSDGTLMQAHLYRVCSLSVCFIRIPSGSGPDFCRSQSACKNSSYCSGASQPFSGVYCTRRTRFFDQNVQKAQFMQIKTYISCLSLRRNSFAHFN